MNLERQAFAATRVFSLYLLLYNTYVVLSSLRLATETGFGKYAVASDVIFLFYVLGTSIALWFKAEAISNGLFSSQNRRNSSASLTVPRAVALLIVYLAGLWCVFFGCGMLLLYAYLYALGLKAELSNLDQYALKGLQSGVYVAIGLFIILGLRLLRNHRERIQAPTHSQ